MKIIHGIRNWNYRFRYPVVTLGIFDGVHLGHQKIILEAVRRADAAGGTSIIVTFHPHPLRVIKSGSSPSLLTAHGHKLKLLAALGGDFCLVIRFTPAFSRVTPREFVRGFLVRKMGVKEVLVGENYAFGRDHKGTIDLLEKAAAQSGFSLRKIRLVKKAGRIVSSTLIRQLIERGDLLRAGKFLGRPVSVLGTVVSGSARGRILGFPTANLNPHHEAIPPGGVYAVRIRLGRKELGGMVNIGTCPTFRRAREEKGEIPPRVEVHIFDFKRDIYGREMEIVFIKRIRAEKLFSDRNTLVRQIRRDQEAARRIIGG